MAEMIEFPTSWSRWYEMGLRACRDQDYQEAKDYFYKSLDIEFQSITLIELLEVVLLLREYEEAEQVVKTYFPTIESMEGQDQLVLLYAKTLHSKGLAPLDQIVLSKLITLVASNHEIVQEIQQLLDDYQAQGMRILEVEYAIKNQMLDQYMKEFSLKRLNDQLDLLKAIFLSDSDSTEVFLLSCLKEKDLSNYCKAQILHYLIDEGIREEVHITWFNQDRILDLSRLERQDQTPFYFNAMRYIEDYCQKQDPHLLVSLLFAFENYSMCFYPFYKEVASDSESLAKNFLDFQLNHSVDVNAYFMLALEEIAPLLFTDLS